MGVGTSLGQSYDDEFHWSQSQWDTKYDTNKAQAISIKPVQETTTPEGGLGSPTEPAGEFNPQGGTSTASDANTSVEPSLTYPEPYGLNPPPSKFFDRLFGLNGEERYQTWPEEAVRGIGRAFDVANKVSSGEVSMWAQDPNTGEFHTSIEGMKNAWELVPLAMGGQIPLKIHLGQPSEVTTLKTLSQHEDEFAAMIRRYREEGFTAEQRTHFPEQDARMANHPRWNEGNHPEPALSSNEWRQFEADMAAYDEQHAARRVNPSAPGVGNWRRVDANDSRASHEIFEADMRAQDTAHATQYADEIRELLRQSRLQESYKTKALGSDTISEGQIYLSRLKSPFQEHETKHRFRFFDEKSGSKGNLSITEKQNGKQLYVEGIGLTDGINPQDIGYAGTKDMLYALKKEFPEAETVAGFRVSGARAKANAVGHAEMKLPKGTR